MRLPLARQSRQHGSDFRPIFPAQSQYGAGLNDDLEQFAALIIEIEQITGQNQVAGRGHRQKLGQPLDDAQNKGFEQE